MQAEGIYPILYAYYADDGQLDREAMRRQVECCIASGAHGIAVLGLITEVQQLTPGERETVMAWASEDINSRVPLAATIAGETPQAQIALVRRAEALGTDWLILQPPQTYKPSEEELMRFFGEIMGATDLPVGIQNFPEVLGVGLSPKGVGDLHKAHPNFNVMKGEGPVYQIRQYLDASHGGIGIFNGRGGIELPDNLRAGCAGIIPAPDCADVQIAMYQAFKDGDHQQMDHMYERLLPYVTFVMQSVDFALAYGKRYTAQRMGIRNASVPRQAKVSVDEFGLERLAAHSRMLGAFGEYSL